MKNKSSKIVNEETMSTRDFYNNVFRRGVKSAHRRGMTKGAAIGGLTVGSSIALYNTVKKIKEKRFNKKIENLKNELENCKTPECKRNIRKKIKLEKEKYNKR